MAVVIVFYTDSYMQSHYTGCFINSYDSGLAYISDTYIGLQQCVFSGFYTKAAHHTFGWLFYIAVYL